MDEANAPDHLSSSLTDLMTSLMVIFILLLLVFVSHSASKDASATDALMTQLRTQLKRQTNLAEKDVQLDPRDRNAILIVVPDELMSFDSSKSDLKQQGVLFLKGKPGDAGYTRALASVLCQGDLSKSVETVVIEGHTDTHRWGNDGETESENKKLRLSQDRSMAVVQEMLSDLGTGTSHACFLEKLSATGRGEQDAFRDDPDQRKNDERSRRVIFRIRVKAAVANKVEHSVQAGKR
jgi:outer membrane protein OmpA-like peptidoglycan-associated protein